MNIELPEPCKTCACSTALRLAILQAELGLTENQMLKILKTLDEIPNCETCPDKKEDNDA